MIRALAALLFVLPLLLAACLAGPAGCQTQSFPANGHSVTAARLRGCARRAAPFAAGPLMLARLSPVDYHHNHYFDDGTTLDTAWEGGRLWTVNWRALRTQPDLLFRNHRQISILDTRNFGRVAFVEIGAM